MSVAGNIEIGSNRRNVQLDCLRGVAILMVIMCHTILFRRPGWDKPIVLSGWAGVDLFFVLSGFLISGLLFSEYRRTGGIRFRRFAIRRALKLYPAFYTLLIIAVIVRLVSGDPKSAIFSAFAHDVFFLQSYFPGTYGHFWSLSVEEHFYVLLPLTMYFLMRRKGRDDKDPFRFLPGLFVIVAIVLLSARLLNAAYVPFAWQTHLFPTHLRIDSLLFGVVLSYWAHFHGDKFWGFVRPRYYLFFLVGAFLISPLFYFSQYDKWMYTYGFVTLYLGFGAILLGALSVPLESLPKSVQALPRALAFIGGFSYSIYLWHIPWLALLENNGLVQIPYFGLAAFIIGSITIGILMSVLVEIPAIRLRDRFFPRDSTRTPVAVPAANAPGAFEAGSYPVAETAGIDPLN